ncbi:uncharacterized protein EKO05_0004071 [Ascochyta rabiei]|uniref:Calcium ion binding n=1 Tax=Didymella rabiei TaxID=5454 RepID=A0A162XHV0_DIDRA|nr:uncharacterized protein EKO05_0004071 [Ascochyta rabiei]KZM19555.1 calcium ion binding [Ascochyta rabiei]UPX13568.1 hypothetical protein EKO05_0004071 [Ascochyta rabiei]
MSNATPAAVSRYRPAVLVLIGAAASYTAYLVYSNYQAASSDGLHRTNAVRRSNLQRRPSRTTRIISRLERNVHALGEYNILGLVVPLDPQNLISPDELRELLVPLAPDAGEDIIEVETARMYDVFLDRLLDSAFSTRPLAPAEIEAISLWIGDRLPNSATVSRAIERRTQRLNDARPVDVDGAESIAATDMSWNSDEDTDGEGIDPDGQTLQRTLYHIAEDRARQEGVIHRGITCNACDEKPIRGTRWHCANCVDFDLCSNCEATNSHTRTHVFYKIRVPAPYLSLAKQEPLYPGKPHMMHHSVNSSLKRRLGSETNMEVEEIEALWDQFTCLASTEWTSDPNKIGWALDRRAFNYAFVPRYNGFVSAPNLIYDRVFAYYDSDNNGLIGFEEWIKGIDGMHTSDLKVKAKIVFNGYDIDGDGYISRRDVLRVFRAYYAIEKEATRNFVAELTEELSVRNSMDTIRSGQPLGSAFPPNSLPTPNSLHSSLEQKHNATFDDASPVVLDTDFEVATRNNIIKAPEISQLLEGSYEKDSNERLDKTAWARREFTLDEEEGLTKPDGAKDQDEEEELRTGHASPSSPEAEPAQTPFRRSSRVHFQDEVNHKDWSLKSSPKEPVSEQWGGYEIPELERDMGKEVLYQITQQAFNELLDPLFRAREDMAMDARNLRSERRKHAKTIDTLLEKERGWGSYNSAILHTGIFRFVKGVVDVYCQSMNKPGVLDAIKRHEYKDDPEWYANTIRNVVVEAEELVLETVKPRKEYHPLDGVAEWNAELFREQLHQEIEKATLRLLAPYGPSPGEDLPRVVARDPTMPQFRPNSTADIDANALADAVEEPQEHASTPDVEQDLEKFADEDGRIRIGPQGPFFVSARHSSDEDPSHEEEQVHDLITPITTPPLDIELHSSEDRIIINNNDPSTTTNGMPITPTTSHNAPEEEASSSSPSHGAVKIPHVTNTPWLQILCLNTSSSGVQTMSYTRHHVAHLQNPYAIAPEPDQTAALTANVRRNAKNPESPLYTTLLASCEAVDQESRERKGNGLLSFGEFEEHLKDGKLRFLESWMDWVSV